MEEKFWNYHTTLWKLRKFTTTIFAKNFGKVTYIIKGLKRFTIKHIFLNCKLWFFAWICLKMVLVNQLVHESMHQNQLLNPISTHHLRSTQGVKLSNFDTILSILQGIYDKIFLCEIGKWFIINIFHKVSDK